MAILLVVVVLREDSFPSNDWGVCTFVKLRKPDPAILLESAAVVVVVVVVTSACTGGASSVEAMVPGMERRRR